MAQTDSRSARIQQLFSDALELRAQERAEFLFAACAGDAELRREVESLLESDEPQSSFLQSRAFEISASEIAAQVLESEEAAAVGKLVGAYRIVREIGRGGMGTVYLAERTDGQFQKRVAIKLLRRGLENEAVIRRFQNERQILADLEHPNIARLIDGGTTENGLPYFVMEYVEGLTVSHFCSEQNLTIEERLNLFREICAALQFAHEHSIIHRDIKPSNILVTKTGTPKLLDFGIAKTSANNETSASTATALRAMTPEYASPEQMRGERVGKASDIYSLGVLLYELLTGHRPYNFDSKSPYEIVQAICEEEPLAPSRLMAEGEMPNAKFKAAERSNGNLKTGKTEHEIIPHAGDLDNIVLKSLRKEPERRYSSVFEFSEDVRHLLEGSPVSARQDTFFYHSAKFFRRHQIAVLSALAAAVIFVLAGFSLSFLNQRLNANEANYLLTSADPDQNLPIDKRKGGSDNPEARELYLKAQSLWNQRTILSLRQAVELFEQALEKDPQFALALSGLSNSYFLLSVWGRIPAKEAFPKAKVAASKAVELAPESAEAHLSLAMIYWLYEYDWQAADREFKQAIQLNPSYARAPHWYGLFLAEMGRFDEAIASEKRALEIVPNSLPVNADLGRVLYYARRYDESAEQYRKTVAMDPNFGAFYSELGELYEAAGMAEEWYALMEKIKAFNDPVFREAYQKDGMNGYRRKVLESLQSSQSVSRHWHYHYTQAEFYAQLGEKNAAFELLNTAFEERDHRMAQLKVNPKLDNLRGDPRFTALLKRIKLDSK
ncbi:MAG TPA: protein kinase [Pyrinomonadaceae bacterium]